jgi:hypothetical protein
VGGKKALPSLSNLKGLAIVAIFQTPVEDIAPHLNQAELLLKLPDSMLGVKFLAGKDIDVDIAPLREGVDADVAFGDEDESGDTPILGLGADVSCYLRG